MLHTTDRVSWVVIVRVSVDCVDLYCMPSSKLEYTSSQINEKRRLLAGEGQECRHLEFPNRKKRRRKKKKKKEKASLILQYNRTWIGLRPVCAAARVGAQNLKT